MDEFKDILNVYYSTFFYDNKEVIGFLENIDSKDGNRFDVMTKKLLKTNNTPEILFLSKYSTYFNVLISIAICNSVQRDIFYTDNNFYSIYQSIDNIIFTNKEPSETDNSKAKVVNEIYNMSKTKYILKGNQLHIYDELLMTLEFSKKTYKYQGNSDIDDTAILSNYVMFLFSFQDYSLMLQMQAIDIILACMALCYTFRMLSELIIANGASVERCKLVHDILEEIENLETSFKTMQKNSGDTGSYNNISTKCTLDCLVTLSILDSDIIVEKPSTFHDDYFVNIGSKTYEIVTVDYDDIEDSTTTQRISSIVLKGIGNEAKCPNNRNYPYVDVKIDEIVEITIRTKNIIDMKHTFIKNGNILKNLNSKIEKSKNSINKMAKQNDKQIEMLYNINLRMYIYYGIFMTIIVTYIVMLLINFDNSLKLNAAGVLLIVISVMNIANYFLNYSNIERFSNYVKDGSCELLNANSSIAERVEYVDNTSKALKARLLNFLSHAQTLLSSFDSSEFYKTISGSLKNEVKSFTEYENVYNYKADISKKSIDIMKHEMIDKTAFINFLSISFLIIATIFVIHTFINNNAFVKVYAVIISLLVLFNLYIYYYKILHPVRTMARYNYWYKPSDSVQRSMS